MALDAFENTLEGYYSIPKNSALEAAAQTFQRGDPLIATGSDGQIQEPTTNPVANIVGIAAAPASGITNEEIAYIPSNASGVLFVGRVRNDAGDVATALSQLLENFRLQLDTGVWKINVEDNATPCVQIIGFVDPVGTVGGRVKFKFLPSTILLQ